MPPPEHTYESWNAQEPEQAIWAAGVLRDELGASFGGLSDTATTADGQTVYVSFTQIVVDVASLWGEAWFWPWLAVSVVLIAVAWGSHIWARRRRRADAGSVIEKRWRRVSRVCGVSALLVVGVGLVGPRIAGAVVGLDRAAVWWNQMARGEEFMPRRILVEHVWSLDRSSGDVLGRLYSSTGHGPVRHLWLIDDDRTVAGEYFRHDANVSDLVHVDWFFVIHWDLATGEKNVVTRESRVVFSRPPHLPLSPENQQMREASTLQIIDRIKRGNHDS